MTEGVVADVGEISGSFRFVFVYLAVSLLLCEFPSIVSVRGLLSSCSAQASHPGGCSGFGTRALGREGSPSCGTRAQQLSAGPWSTSSVVTARGLRCSMACGIFLDQESNLHVLHWQVDSLPLNNQGRPLGALELTADPW